MSNLPRFIAAVAHITDFPIERSERQGDNVYFCNGATLVGTEEGNTITVSVTARNGRLYKIRVYGGVSLYHNVLKCSIRLDTRLNQYVTYNNCAHDATFSNLHDAMRHCVGIYGWL